jgi:hypothetical protein
MQCRPSSRAPSSVQLATTPLLLGGSTAWMAQDLLYEAQMPMQRPRRLIKRVVSFTHAIYRCPYCFILKGGSPSGANEM